MKRKRICLLHVPVFNPARAIGGAEVIAVDMVRWLSEENDVTVLHGFLGEPQQPGAMPSGPERHPTASYPAEIMPGFRLDDHGFLKEMLPAGHGLYHADPALPAGELAQEALTALREGRRLCLRHGRPYIENRYSLHRMGEQFTELVRTL